MVADILLQVRLNIKRKRKKNKDKARTPQQRRKITGPKANEKIAPQVWKITLQMALGSSVGGRGRHWGPVSGAACLGSVVGGGRSGDGAAWIWVGGGGGSRSGSEMRERESGSRWWWRRRSGWWCSLDLGRQWWWPQIRAGERERESSVSVEAWKEEENEKWGENENLGAGILLPDF
jgi:hypothetical protein